MVRRHGTQAAFRLGKMRLKLTIAGSAKWQNLTPLLRGARLATVVTESTEPGRTIAHQSFAISRLSVLVRMYDNSLRSCTPIL
jgi:hypothetical protein